MVAITADPYGIVIITNRILPYRFVIYGMPPRKAIPAFRTAPWKRKSRLFAAKETSFRIQGSRISKIFLHLLSTGGLQFGNSTDDMLSHEKIQFDGFSKIYSVAFNGLNEIPHRLENGQQASCFAPIRRLPHSPHAVEYIRIPVVPQLEQNHFN